MKRINLLLMSLLMAIGAFPQNATNPKLGTNKVEDVVSAMTLKEKVWLLVGMGDEAWKKPADGQKSVMLGDAAGLTYAIPRLGITPAVLTDGPAGLRIKVEQELAPHPFYCTAFPTATALASTWNAALVENVGKAMGNEVLEYGSDVLLAPAINNQRNPLGGRNFEYYSEDPLIAGKLSAAMIRGIQSNGVGTSLKHFAANNIETNRNTVNAVISQRALREIYLRGFEIAVKEAQPWTVMTSYNRINGFYTSENHDLLTTILRDEWGFKGMVMTDWWGGKDAVAQMNAGNDMLMPGNHQRDELINAVNNKLLNEDVLNQNVSRALAFIMKTPRFRGYALSYTPDLKAHAQVAQNAAVEAMVLLKNDKTALPFASNVKRIALFGKTSYRFIAGGTGSGEVNYEKAVSIDEALANNGYKLLQPLSDLYKNFIDTVIANAKPQPWPWSKKTVVDFHPELALSQSQINDQVKNSDIAVITIGRNAGEGADRKVENFSLSQTEKDLIKNVASAYHAAGKKAVVVLNIGSPIAITDWRDDADAVLLAWQPGQEGANALADILKGKVSPSGKLAETFPVKYEDVPSANTFPGEPKDNPVNAFYNEGIYVGYRYYSTFKVPVAYEFGYGLSYTTFQYSDITLNNDKNNINVSVKVKNTGKIAGKEIVQLYVSAPTTEIEKPTQELRAFAKTGLLKPGESETVSFTLTNRDLASFRTDLSSWVADKGTYEVRIGASSNDIRQKVSFDLPQTVVVEKVHNVLYPNMFINELSTRTKGK